MYVGRLHLEPHVHVHVCGKVLTYINNVNILYWFKFLDISPYTRKHFSYINFESTKMVFFLYFSFLFYWTMKHSTQPPTTIRWYRNIELKKTPQSLPPICRYRLHVGIICGIRHREFIYFLLYLLIVLYPYHIHHLYFPYLI